MGMVYKHGAVYWIKYYVNGKPIRENTRTAKQKEAERVLKDREGRAANDQPILPKVTRICVEELLDDLRADYRTTGRRTLREADTRLVPLKQFFTGYRASSVTGDVLTDYIQQRQEATVANGTINRELSMLGTAFRLGLEHGKVLRQPIVHLLKEADPREGFFEEGDFRTVRTHLPQDLRVAVTIMYTFGWRSGEVMGSQLSQVDLNAGTLRLEPGTTKNGKGRVVYLTPELEVLLQEQVQRVRTVSKHLNRVLPWLFPHLSGCYLGKPRKTFYKVWRAACERAGVGGPVQLDDGRTIWKGPIPHDFRRTAVRNMERAGVPRSHAMKATGHKTESIYTRYAIVSDSDMKEVTERLTGTKRAQPTCSALDADTELCEKPRGLA